MSVNSDNTKKILRQFAKDLSLLKSKQKETIERNIKKIEKRKIDDIRKKLK
ncbi:MAG TPA: hypothetical protein P5230_03400 [Candidatus Magasanikbacteria bacterium]|nr:hypothetical protein [Candidatus Magasanikbacteria bacterium]